MLGSSTLLTMVCEGWCPPGIKCATGSGGWKGSVLQMPAAWVPATLAKPKSPALVGVCCEMPFFFFLISFCFVESSGGSLALVCIGVAVGAQGHLATRHQMPPWVWMPWRKGFLLAWMVRLVLGPSLPIAHLGGGTVTTWLLRLPALRRAALSFACW